MGMLKEVIINFFRNKELNAKEQQEVLRKLFQKIQESKA